MGNITSQDLLDYRRIESRLCPTQQQLAKVDSRIITQALNFVWDAYLQQNLLRDDKKVFKRQAGILTQVFSGEWPGLTEREWVDIWKEWRGLIVAIVKGLVVDPRVLDLLHGVGNSLDGVGDSLHLPVIHSIYIHSSLTPKVLLALFGDLKTDSYAHEWAFTTSRWLKTEWHIANNEPELKEQIIAELQSVVNGLAGDDGKGDERLRGNERKFVDKGYNAFPALQKLLAQAQHSRHKHDELSIRIRFLPPEGDVPLSLAADSPRLERRELPKGRREREEEMRTERRRRNRSASPAASPTRHPRYALNHFSIAHSAQSEPHPEAMQMDSLSHASPYSRRQRHIYRM